VGGFSSASDILGYEFFKTMACRIESYILNLPFKYIQEFHSIVTEEKEIME
jgi:hypothetical protein